MPLFQRNEPDLRPLIAYIVARARERQITLNRTKLVKLLYLIDVERIRTRRQALTGLDWVFFHYGPYAFELIDTLEAMEGSELIAQPWKGTVLYRNAPDAPDGEDWVAGTRSMVEHIINRFAPLDLNELLDYVYFHTGPMVGAERGQSLDMSRAREQTTPRRPVPLRPPTRPDNIEQRLSQWRARTAQRLAPVVLDPPGVFLDDPADDLAGEGIRGRLHVPERTLATMHGWIEPFYELAEPSIAPGHIWCDQPIYLPPRHGLKIERIDPQDDRNLEFTVCGRTADTFNHPPVHSLALESSEAAVIAKTKRNRPVIILGGTTATELRRASTQHAETVMVVPVYGADQYDEHTRRRVSYYEFTNAFYLPAYGRPRFDEGFARLDHAEPVRQRLLVEHRGLKLASDALDALVEWFVAFSTNRQLDDSLILEYRREQLADDS